MRASGWAPVLLLAVLAGGVEGRPATVDPLPDHGLLSQPTLEAVAARFARVWAGSDPAAIGALVAPAGAGLHLDGTAHGTLGSRKMAAALGSFLQGHRSREVEVVRVSEVGGSPPRGFIELAWRGVRAGTVETLAYTVYVGFVMEDEDWRVTEVRVMR